MRAAALGYTRDVAELIESGSDSSAARDHCERTAWLIATDAGDVEKMRLLLPAGADIEGKDRDGMTAPARCAASGDDAGLSWLIAAGAGDHEVYRLFLAAGGYSSDVKPHCRHRLVGLPDEDAVTEDDPNVTAEEYFAGRYRRPGVANPEFIEVPFWNAMVRAGCNACRARDRFGDDHTIHREPVWCFDRFGESFTELADGRFVMIGGEHEDFYDPDLCIHNDVTVHNRDGTFLILGCPDEVFPPTDFHTATRVGESIYIIGSLGYQGHRQFGTTPVYRLDCRSWAIEPVAMSGENPGWIHDHRTRAEGDDALIVTGGKVGTEVREEFIANTDTFHLNLRSGAWRRARSD